MKFSIYFIISSLFYLPVLGAGYYVSFSCKPTKLDENILECNFPTYGLYFLGAGSFLEGIS